MLSFQLLLIVASVTAVIVAACLQPTCVALRHIDLGTIFLLMWLGGSAFIANAFFLSSICSSNSLSNFVIFMNFMILVFTIAFSNTILNPPSIMLYQNLNQEIKYGCVFQLSSYNAIYSSALTGGSFVQFIVFFMPWFHVSQAIGDILSVAQLTTFTRDYYQHPPIPFVVASTNGFIEFQSRWISWSFFMLALSSVVFTLLAWFFGQVLSSSSMEGRNILSVLLPSFVRDILFGQTLAPLPGDVRGIEQEKSRVEKSVRAYKISKTYSGVQALKEVSFTMSTGQVFVLLGHNG